MQLEVTHETRYDYSAPVSLAHHLAHLRPLSDAYQQLLSFALEIDPAPSHSRDGHDRLGNAERHFSLALPHRKLRVRAASRVQLTPRFDRLQPESAPAWDAVAARLRYKAPGAAGHAGLIPEVEFALPSPYVPRLVAMRGFAHASFTPGRPLAAAAIELMQRIHGEFAYRARSTQIDTPLFDVWEKRRGVCQDFAHVMAGAMRMLGLPVRYVSGYLLTTTPAGVAMQGAEASHAWVQAWCPGTVGVPADGWLDLDPTNGLVPDTGHVRLAVGRDFGDVTPLRGVIRGGGRHLMTVAVSTRVATPLPKESAR
ncbi:MAG TPA: transglutaminase family protein [Rubrivivax sp.]|jgi:transglutaminase-like putative cysteine protease|nr:transglutaminase family protein [Rubrivivax sp.]